MCGGWWKGAYSPSSHNHNGISNSSIKTNAHFTVKSILDIAELVIMTFP